MLEARDEAYTAVQRILNEDESRFEVVAFENFNAIGKLRSQYYNGFYLIFLENYLRSAGQLSFMYVKNGGCLLEKSIIRLQNSPRWYFKT